MTRILGYHGCEKSFADGVRSGRITLAEWKLSRNSYDWLGEGIYFWEGSRSRAEQWSVERFGDEADVLVADITLGECLNMLEDTYHDDLRVPHNHLKAVYRREKRLLPKNHDKRHDLDNVVINRFGDAAAQRGLIFQTIRGVFEEGRPVFPGSAIRTQSHIQVAVRDAHCIRIRTLPEETP